MNRVATGVVLFGLAQAVTVSLSVSQGALHAREGQAGAQPAFRPPRGLESQAIQTPADNPMTAGKIRLGEQLFFDKRLSKTKQMSCETCHVPEKGWTDGLAFSPRFDGSMNTRHTPTLIGTAFYTDFYWDGRARGLEAQILAAWRGQMGADPDAVAKEIEAIPGYLKAFMAEFGGPPNAMRVAQAIASFVRTIHAGDTPWDRHPQDPAALKKTEVGRGFTVFSDVAHCTNCHLPPVFADTLFHNIGIGFDKEKPDMGRGQILADAAAKANQPVTDEIKKQMGAFKTPTMRGVTLSAPYFHDGRAATLEEAVDLLVQGGIRNDNLDEKLQPAALTPQQKKELLTFLRAITPAVKPYKRPALP
jgi:cytochrome c peroxidase